MYLGKGDRVSLLEIARRRISTRKFSGEKIDLKDVAYAVDVARQAPSGANRQPWRFIIVTDRELKEKIRASCEAAERDFHERAPGWMKRWLAEKGISWRKDFLAGPPSYSWCSAGRPSLTGSKAPG